MQALAFHTIEKCAGSLDHLRAILLRYTLQVPQLRPYFYTRSRRLAVLFLVACLLNFGLAVLFPLWVLLLGPLVYGLPHIFSSVRYFHYTAENDSRSSKRKYFSFGMIGLILLSVFSYRLFVTTRLFGLSLPQLSEWKGSTYIELIALGLTFLGGILIYRKSLRQIGVGLLLIIPFIFFYCLNPTYTVGAMVLIHNFVAFIFWILGTKTRVERRVAFASFGLLLALTVSVFLGAWDWVYRFTQPQMILNFANLSIADTGQLIAPWSDQNSLWLHACIAFALGQSLHYFVWLKAIPDQYHYLDVPTSFRQSLVFLEADFGRAMAIFLVLSSIGVLVLWSFMTFQMARLVYFCLASYHGYLEVAGLGLARIGTRQAPSALR